MATISLVCVSAERFAAMADLAKVCPGLLLPATADETAHGLRSEEGRMTAKGLITLRARGGTYTLRQGLAKGDVSPLWRAYWLAGELAALREELSKV